MKDLFADLKIPAYDLEAFMKSITYAPDAMPNSLARQIIEQQHPEWPAPLREVCILRKALEMLPIGIHDSDIIAGNYGTCFAQEDYIAAARKADAEIFEKSEEYKYRSEDERITAGRYMLFGIYTPSHTCVDYPKIIKRGLKQFEAEIQQSMRNPKMDEYGKMYLSAMQESIDAVKMFAGRYAQLTEKKLHNCTDPLRRFQLERMRSALLRVPYEPAADLFEALQSIWIVHTVTPASERSWASVSLGRMDIFLLDFYKKWLADGHTLQEAEELFAAFFLLLDSYGDGSGTLNLGPDWNELSKLLLRVEKQVRYRAPIIAVRMAEDAPDDIYDEIIDKSLFEVGQPTFYGEKSCTDAMCYRGVTKEDGHAVNSCMGMVVVGKEIADMWGCCCNMSLPLELAINHGKPLHGELPATLMSYVNHVAPVEPKDMATIKRAYRQYMHAVVSYIAQQNLDKAAWIAMNRPNPWLSAITEDCISFGRDRAHSAVNAIGDEAEPNFRDAGKYDFFEMRKGRGAKYHNTTVLAMGFAHAADALTAIDKLVFGEKKYAVEDFINAAHDNYQGDAKAVALYAALNNCPKYASGDDKADANAAFVLDALADACEANYHGNIRFIPTCHTIDSNVQFGACVYASLDGRRDGEAFGKNAGAVMSAIKSSPTDLMIGSARLPQARFSGGMPIDVYVPDAVLNSEENRAKFRELLKAYFAMGGMQVQVNNVSLDLLRKAYDDPAAYSQVIVRKGGFSIYFTDMLKEVQKDMIERFEKELQS